VLGQTLDYWILRPLTHDRNAKTEEELNYSYATQQTPLALEHVTFRLQKLMHRLEGEFPVASNLRYLDIGCGTGDMTVALARAGCKNITGIDFVPRMIAQARLNAVQLRVDDCAEFICEDFHEWKPVQKYDVILSHEALEHITIRKHCYKRRQAW
jgi:2-polyprenyl-3-methyl-5-hydroxy-6-metoxy-1,4-benzoquinol methylase